LMGVMGWLFFSRSGKVGDGLGKTAGGGGVSGGDRIFLGALVSLWLVLLMVLSE